MSTMTLDAVVVGAGFAGLYALHKLRSQGLSVRVFETAPDVGGTWYFNRYPGARCDVESIDYCYSFSDELQQEWNWTEKYATQAEILRYLNWVTDKLDLRRDITFNTAVTSAVLDERTLHWTVTTGSGEVVTARFCLMATGPLSAAITPNFEGLETFGGEVYHTAHWPHDGVDFTGKRVAVIGTGSSGIQSIPVIAEQAAQLYVFQRTPNFSVPAGNKPLTPQEMAEIKKNYDERRRLSWRSGGGSPHVVHPKMTMEVSHEERRAVFEKRWQLGGVLFSKTFPDQLSDPAANEEARRFYDEKVRALIDDPEVADLLIPDDHPIGTKRICTDSNYFQTFNRSDVELISVRKTPIESIDTTGINTTDAHYDLDMIVLATGFDAMTGALSKIDIVGRRGEVLREHWKHGPRTYLGLGVDGFPNLFIISGPGAPAVLANMVLHAEAHVNWIADCINYVDEHGYTAIEASADAVNRWIAELATTGRRHPVSQGQLLVRRRQRARQAAGVHVVRRWIRCLQRHLRRGRRDRLLGLHPDQGVVMSGLLDKVVLVTGAARGMGRTHCERFADEGADVIALDISAVRRRITRHRNASGEAR